MYKDRVELIEAYDQLQPLLFVHKAFDKIIFKNSMKHPKKALLSGWGLVLAHFHN